MRRLPVVPWWVVVPAYVLGGFALGVADRHLGDWVRQQFGVRPGVATAVSINVVMPMLAVGLAVARPRLGTAWLGALGMTAGFVLGLAVLHRPAAGWGVGSLLRAVPPVLVMACLGYAVLGTLTALATRGLAGRGGLGVDAAAGQGG
jgi:hypothetical protein